MSDFVSFVRSLGILIDHPPPIGRWVRLPTESHPRKKNGAVKFLGDHGFAQEHSTMTEVAVWQADKDATPNIDYAVLRKRAAEQDRRQVERQRKAASKATWIMSQTKPDLHAYTDGKGFPKLLGNVWRRENESPLLVVPMYVDKSLVGCQLIDIDGNKKFLKNQRTNDAAFVIGHGGLNVLVEGFATGLSAQAAMAALKLRYTIYVCFSAGNLGRMAKQLKRGIILADNDASGVGEKVAKETGWPYWISETVGNDLNDDHRARGLFAVSQSLRRVLARC